MNAPKSSEKLGYGQSSGKPMNMPEFIQKNIALNSHTSWLVGGPAEYFVLAKSDENLVAALTWARAENLPITFFGGGSNVLVSDAGVKGLVIALGMPAGVEVVEDGNKFSFWISASASKSELLKIFLKRRLEPALFLAGLPGQVGGGVVMNAGVSENLMPREFCEIVKAVEVLRPGEHAGGVLGGSVEGGRQAGRVEKVILQASQLQWSYRHCEGWAPGVITRVLIEWENVPRNDIITKVKELNKNRLTKQPLEFPSCGSVFRNPKDDPQAKGRAAAQLIEAAGLKGFSRGGAQISEKHGNFIINRGGAKASDIKFLIEHVQKTILAVFGIQLKTEVVFMGKF